ncbi:MAG: flagellar filament capping protein FliD [Burkholderiaceae bacterium]|jgi:flagellar hook-associated protein 2|nr:flagellar filament capping protein FliD [Burkholderiaceae bacterium]
MATSAIGGGAIDVATLVSQLMSIERRPLEQLQQREATIQSKLSAFGRLQSAFDALETAATKLASTSLFNLTSARAIGDGASATGNGDGVPGRYAVSVTALARVQSSAAQGIDPATVFGAGALEITHDGTTTTIPVGGTGEPTTLAGLRDAINAQTTLGVRASLVNDGGLTRLVLNSRSTGLANAFSVNPTGSLATLTFGQLQPAQDASFSVNGLALTSSSNEVGGVIEGVTLSLTKAPPAGAAPGTTVDAEIVVEQDGDGVRAGVEAFVKAYNDTQKLIADLSKFDPTTRTAAVLNSETLLRQMQSGLRSIIGSAMTPASGTDFTRLSEVGVEAQVDGTLALNATKFDAALKADAGKVARLFNTTTGTDAQQGFAPRLVAQIKLVADPSGALEQRQTALRDAIKRIDSQQEQIEARLALTQARLTRQYSALDALVSSRQQQSAALANALAGLTGTS